MADVQGARLRGVRFRLGRYRVRFWWQGFEIESRSRGRVFPFPWSSFWWRRWHG